MARAVARSGNRGAVRLARIGLALAVLSPLTVAVALTGLKGGAWGVPVAFDLLTMKVALGLAGLGVLAALAALAAAFSAPRQAGLTGLVAAIISGVTVAVFTLSITNASKAVGNGDVSTDEAETPAFASQILAAREAMAADAVPAQASAGGCEVTALTSQVAPGVAGYALQSAGFEVRGLGVGRSDGSRTGSWFGFTHDAVVRIRPDRTDVRVTARDRAHDRGEACRLARKVIDGLTA